MAGVLVCCRLAHCVRRMCDTSREGYSRFLVGCWSHPPRNDENVALVGEGGEVRFCGLVGFGGDA
jgi:hypothetical protein